MYPDPSPLDSPNGLSQASKLERVLKPYREKRGTSDVAVSAGFPPPLRAATSGALMRTKIHFTRSVHSSGVGGSTFTRYIHDRMLSSSRRSIQFSIVQTGNFSVFVDLSCSASSISCTSSSGAMIFVWSALVGERVAKAVQDMWNAAMYTTGSPASCAASCAADSALRGLKNAADCATNSAAYYPNFADVDPRRSNQLGS